jgi:multidrug resistance efflux pump
VLATANRELKAKIGSLEASIAKNKGLIDDAQGLLNRNIDLHMGLKVKDEKLKEAKGSHKNVEVARKKAEELAEANAQKLEVSRAALLACMQEAKVALDAVFAKVSSELSKVLLDCRYFLVQSPSMEVSSPSSVTVPEMPVGIS